MLCKTKYLLYTTKPLTSRPVISSLFVYYCLLSLILSASCNETNSQSDVPSSKYVCVIGRLRECLEDEVCKENSNQEPESKAILTSLNNRNSEQNILNSTTLIPKPSGLLYGSCVCRRDVKCKRSPVEMNRRTPKFNSMIDDSHLDDAHRNSHFSAGWFFGFVCIIVALGSISFLVYYYGFRYGMFSYYARQFGFTDNTQIEHQLLNRVSTEDGTELHI